MNNSFVPTAAFTWNYLTSVILSYVYPFIRIHALLPKPTYISLFVGRNCPLHCRHCSFWKKKDTTYLTYEKGKQIIDTLYAWLGPFRLNISGGEPLLNNNILPLVSYASQKGIVCGMASNGFLINEKIAKKIIDSGLANINISLDSLHPTIHDRIRGTRGVHAKAVQAIALLKKYRTNKKTYIYINTVISRENMNGLVALAKWTKQQNLDGINFQPIVSDRTFGNTHAKKQWYKKNPLWPNKKVINILNELEVLKPKKCPINNLEPNEVAKLKTYFLNPDKSLPFNCQIALRNFYIDQRGNVQICQNFPHIGNLLKKSPEKIWKSIKADMIRKKINRCHDDCQLLLCNRPHHPKRMFRSFLKFFR